MAVFRRLALLVGSAVSAGCATGNVVDSVPVAAVAVKKNFSLLESFVSSVYAPLPRPEKGFTGDDGEHAALVGSVLERGSVAFHHIEPSFDKASYVLKGGSLSFHGLYPDRTVQVRPIDGNQDVEIAIHSVVNRLEIESSRKQGEEPALKFAVYAPDIFSPSVSVSRLEIDGIRIPVRYVRLSAQRPREIAISLEKLLKDRVISEREVGDGRLDVRMDVLISLKEYKSRADEEFGSFKHLKNLPTGLETFVEQDEEYKDDPIVQHYAKKLRDAAKSPLHLAKFAFKFAQDVLDYDPVETGYSVGKAIETNIGDCDDYTDIMVAMLRIGGVPSRDSTKDTDGLVLDFWMDGFHAWPETALPLKDGSFAWFISEPTWADESKDVWKYFQTADRRYIYKFGIVPKFSRAAHRISANIVYSPKGKFSKGEVDAALYNAHNALKDSLLKAAMAMPAWELDDDHFILAKADSKGRKFLAVLGGNSLDISYASDNPKKDPLSEKDKPVVDAMSEFAANLEKGIGLVQDRRYDGIVSFRKLDEIAGRDVSVAWLKISRYALERFYDEVEAGISRMGLVDAAVLKKLRAANGAARGRNLYELLKLSSGLPKTYKR